MGSSNAGSLHVETSLVYQETMKIEFFDYILEVV